MLTIPRSTLSSFFLLFLAVVSTTLKDASCDNVAAAAADHNSKLGRSNSSSERNDGNTSHKSSIFDGSNSRKYHFSTHTHSEANRYLHEQRLEHRRRRQQRKDEMKRQQEEQQQQRRRDETFSKSQSLRMAPNNNIKNKIDDDEWVYVMAECRPEEDWKACVDRIQSCGTEETLSVLRYMGSIHMVALAVIVGQQHQTMIEECVGATEEDPVRQPFFIPESLEIIDDISSIRDNEEGGGSGGGAKGRLMQSEEQVMPYGVYLIRAPEVWEQLGTRGEGVKVCILDSGISYPHPDLDDVLGYEGDDLVQPWNEDDVTGHGTHVTGTVSASDNGLGVIGVAPGAQVIFGRVFDDDGVFHSSDIVAGLEACRDNGAQVVNLSLGGPGMSRREQIILESFFENDNIVTVAATGNSGDFELSFPAAYDYVVGVAGVGPDRKRASFSTRNAKIDVAAPGVRIASTYPGGRYAFLSGTSMAAPHVSGVVALMLSANPNATPIDIFLSLRATAVNDDSPDEPDTLLGYGVVDALAAVQNISGQDRSPGVDPPVPAPTPTTTVPTPATAPSNTMPSPNTDVDRISAQYVVTMQHYTDQVFGVDNQPGGFPVVRYMCRGNFDIISASRAIRENSQNIGCVEVTDEDGFSGWECSHQCGPSIDDCAYWWNNDRNNVAVGWEDAAVWFECSGDSEIDTQAKFAWLNNGGFDLNVPAGSGASNGKVARLAVRSDYSESDSDLIMQDRLPPVDVTADHIIIGDEVNVRSNGAPDGGYYGWTGVSGCTGSCSVTYEDMEFQSDPSSFPILFFRESEIATRSQYPAETPSGLGSDTGSQISIPVSPDEAETMENSAASFAGVSGVRGLACWSLFFGIITATTTLLL